MNGANMNNFLVKKIITWIVTIAIPMAVIMLGVRLLLGPLFLEVEYRLPNFPEDRFGFTMDDRLKWAKPSVEYLVNNAGIEYLADLKFENGKPIYNERELSHMSDVKLVIQKMLRVWYFDLGLLIIIGIVSWKARFWREYVSGWKNGGFLTLGLLIFAAVFAATSFWQFFAWFHSLFFSGESWLFEYTDTLIRLFPIKFWEDAVAYIGIFSILLSLFFGFGLKPKE